MRFLLSAATLLLCTCTARAACPKTSPYVGFEGDLSELEHDLAGRVVILDDCTMEVQGFNYDGQGPAVWWWGAPSADNRAIRDEGRRIVAAQLERAYDRETITVTLDEGLTWDAVGPVILVWCEDYNANFGFVELQEVAAPASTDPPSPDVPSPDPPSADVPSPESPPPPSPELPSPPPPSPAATPAPSPPQAPASASAPAPAPGPVPAGLGLGLANCLELIPGYYNLHWEVVESNMIMIGLEGRVGPGGNFWMGFGFSLPDATDVTMPGADVAVAGMVNGECFGLDYSLESRNQCSYTQRSGACPDAGLSGDAATNQVELLSCQKVGDVLAATLVRPLAASDAAYDHAWPLDGSGFPVWAMGPVSEGSNASQPIVLYHRLQLPGTASEETIHAPVGKGYRINLGAPSPPSTCTPLLANAGSGGFEAGPAPAPAPEAGPEQVAVLSDTTEFELVTGANPNYPNPPGWGISYHVNGQESPVLSVERGTTYTFKVMAGPSHPLYLTSSILGGGSYTSFEGETVYAGGEDAHGTPEEPYLLTWTPGPDTPDLLYYQCTTHQKLGWEVRVADAPAP